MKNVETILLLVFLQLYFLPTAYAERVKAIHEDGELELEDGRKVMLAGILSPPEGMRMLPVL